MAKAAKAGGKKAMTKSAFLAQVAEETQLTKKQVEAVMDSILGVVKNQLGSKGAGKLVLPGLARLALTRVEKVKGGVEKLNPLTKQMYITKDKPAYNKVTMRPIKALKEALK